jgi:hypothetical protein
MPKYELCGTLDSDRNGSISFKRHLFNLLYVNLLLFPILVFVMAVKGLKGTYCSTFLTMTHVFIDKTLGSLQIW